MMVNNTPLNPTVQSAKNLAWWMYICHAASLLLGLGMLSWIPLIVNYLKRGDTVGTFVQSHHTWMIRTFWWTLCSMIVGYAFFLTLVAMPLAVLIWFCAWIWAAYRLVKGFLTLNEHLPIGAYAIEPAHAM